MDGAASVMRLLAAVVVALSASFIRTSRPTTIGYAVIPDDHRDVVLGTERVPGGIDMSELEMQMNAGCEEGQECEVRDAHRVGGG